MRMGPAVGGVGRLRGVSKWTRNANMATVGEWTGSEVQAAGSAGGRLNVRLGGWRGWGVSRGKAGLHKHPVPLPRPLHHAAKCAARPQWANHTCFSLACLLRLAVPQQSSPHAPVPSSPGSPPAPTALHSSAESHLPPHKYEGLKWVLKTERATVSQRGK